MAFNFGAFAAGFAQSAERSILQQTQRRDEEEDYKKKLELQFEYEEKSRAAAAARSAATSRREKEEKLLEIAGALQSLGYSPDVIAQITQRGQTTVDMAMNIGQSALAKNVDPNSIWQITSTAVDPEDANFDSEANANLSSFAINAQAYRGLFGEAPEVKTFATIEEAVAREQQKVFQLENQGRQNTQEYATAVRNLASYTEEFKRQNPVVADTTINKLADDALNFARLTVYAKDAVLDPTSGMTIVSSKADPNLETLRSVQEQGLAAYSLWERSQAFMTNAENERILTEQLNTRAEIAKSEGRTYISSMKPEDKEEVQELIGKPDEAKLDFITKVDQEGTAKKGTLFNLGDGKQYLYLGYPILQVDMNGNFYYVQGIVY